jgi:hypothetical protein
MVVTLHVQFCNNNSIPAGGQKSNKTACNLFTQAVKMEEFVGTGQEDNSSMLESHSIMEI